jgi:hypothetical protein
MIYGFQPSCPPFRLKSQKMDHFCSCFVLIGKFLVKMRTGIFGGDNCNRGNSPDGQFRLIIETITDGKQED